MGKSSNFLPPFPIFKSKQFIYATRMQELTQKRIFFCAR